MFPSPRTGEKSAFPKQWLPTLAPGNHSSPFDLSEIAFSWHHLCVYPFVSDASQRNCNLHKARYCYHMHHIPGLHSWIWVNHCHCTARLSLKTSAHKLMDSGLFLPFVYCNNAAVNIWCAGIWVPEFMFTLLGSISFLCADLSSIIIFPRDLPFNTFYTWVCSWFLFQLFTFSKVKTSYSLPPLNLPLVWFLVFWDRISLNWPALKSSCLTSWLLLLSFL